MNVLFLTIGRMENIESHSIYPDLLRQFRDHGHQVYIVSPREKRSGLPTELLEQNKAKMLYVRIGNITKCGRVEKGISTIRIEKQYLRAIRKFFSNVRFDLVLYSTPPITLVGVVKYIKKRDRSQTYLLLKDIFPQNAVDIGMLTTKGIKGLVYQYFRRKEKKFYGLSDYIGCMSPANVEYVLKHNSEIDPKKVGVCPNCIEPRDISLSVESRSVMRERCGIPQDKLVFVYGGNLGKPQGIPFLIECMRSQISNPKSFFLIVGDGTEYTKIESFMENEKPNNIRLIRRLPKDDYDRMVAACDVGMIFLDHRFTIPNFPSRLLAYMQAGLPILACTDPNTDVGQVIMEGRFGWWCESNNVNRFSELIDAIEQENLLDYQRASKKFLYDNYDVSKIYKEIITTVEKPR